MTMYSPQNHNTQRTMTSPSPQHDNEITIHPAHNNDVFTTESQRTANNDKSLTQHDKEITIAYNNDVFTTESQRTANND